MYFAVLGKNPEISLEELQLVKPLVEKTINNQIVVFDTEYPEKLEKLGGIIKRGEIITKDDLKIRLLETKLIGVSNNNFGLQLKRNYDIKRYKTVDLFHTDLEIKKKGLEIIDMQNLTGIVKGYQNIKLYETIDFDKPARSMQMGMMPAKLTHIMINIGLDKLSANGEADIYDPFSGSLTTGFIANAMGYNFIGSDIQDKYANENLDRRKHNQFYNPDKKINFFQHDIKKDLNLNNFNEGIPNLIITEGRLGPIVRRDENPKKLTKIQEEVYDLYRTFIKQIHIFYQKYAKILPTMVFTIPQYKENNFIETNIEKLCQELGCWKFNSVDEIYKRPEQNIGRKIIILKQSNISQ